MTDTATQYAVINQNDGSATGSLSDEAFQSLSSAYSAAGGVLKLQSTTAFATDALSPTGAAYWDVGSATVADPEVLVSMLTPTTASTTPRGGPMARKHYFVREVTVGNSSVWQLVMWDGALPGVMTVLGTVAPSGLSTTYGASGIRIRYRCIGSKHSVKVWDATAAEPAWTAGPNSVLIVTEATYTTAGRCGIGAWGGTDIGTGDFVNFDDFKFYQHNKIDCYAKAPTATITSTGSDLANASTTNASTYTQASVGAYKGEVLVVAVNNSRGSTPATVPTISDDSSSVTWAAAYTGVQYSTVATPLDRLTVFVGVVTADFTGGTVTIDFGGVSQSGCSISVVRANGVANSAGTDAFNANIATQATDTLSTSGAITLAAFATTANGAYATFSHPENEGTTAGSGWTLLHSVSHATPTYGLGTEWRTDNDTSVDASWTTSARKAGWAGELVCATAPTITTPSLVTNLRQRRAAVLQRR